ncbi:hypothetical protein QCA50_000797 [Cerrena zonata]|uniref:EVE domain-containing protein n=1 Tax=Cerrena zonata TaxID=2478898 RepID=A0AAW0GU98_9APHY
MSAETFRPQKTDQDNPKWYMVDVTLRSRATHFIPLSLLKHLASLSPSSSSVMDPPEEVAYIEKEGIKAIKDMALINRGRLSVQPVEETAWGTMEMLADRGGWDDMNTKPTAKRKNEKATTKKPPTRKPKAKKSSSDDEAKAEETDSEGKQPVVSAKPRGSKRKVAETEDDTDNTRATRRSTRLKT